MSATPSTKSAASESSATTIARVISYQYSRTKFQNVNFINETPELSIRDGNSFLVTFSCTVNGELFVDEFEAQTDYQEGHQFEIGYAPSNPRTITYSDPIESSRNKAIAWALGRIFASRLIYYLRHKYGWRK
jgi:hypothetical protein